MVKFFKNVLISIVISVIIFLGVDYGIQYYTKHGETVEVPNVIGKDRQEVIQELTALNLIPLIHYSVYTDSLPKFAISDQDPEEKRIVKEGRKIYLTINSLPKPKVRMPKLVDKSKNLAQAILSNSGLEMGKINEQYSLFGTGVVIQQFYDGDTIASGKLVEKGSAINLLVSKYIDVDSVYIRGIDASKVIGWEYRKGYMNENARKTEKKINKGIQDSMSNIKGNAG